MFTLFPLYFGTGADLLVMLLTGSVILAIVAIFIVCVGLYYESLWYELREILRFLVRTTGSFGDGTGDHYPAR